ncbi:hypothetical protein EAH79_11450 [Sphingomonas koreensis]|nr:hypothetical protein EAH79_11450 [Sphingomonas koreensis]
MTRSTRLAGAALAASVVAAALPSARAQSAPGPASPPGLPSVPVTKVIAIGHVTAKWTPEALQTVMPREVRETVALYLQGKLDQWFVRKDQPGVVFVFNSSDPREVHEMLEALPLGREGMMDFDLIPLGPLAPLGLLLGTQYESQTSDVERE